MKNLITHTGRISYAVIAYLLGGPGIIIVIALLWGGCMKW
jgi:hypothetical protein